MPRISVLMPVYNTPPEHLREAMDSILAQTFEDFEFLILNDCSDDPQAEAVVRSYSDPRIRYAASGCRLGIPGARNRLLDMARGEYIAVMDHGGISLPERFAKQVAYLDAHPEVGILNTQFSSSGSRQPSNLPADDISIKKSLMVHCGGICPPSCMLRRSVMEEHGMRYEDVFAPSEDHALFCRLIPHTKFAALPDILFSYRTGECGTSHVCSKTMESAALGVLDFARRDNPELWAMARVHMLRRRRYRFLGIAFMVKEETYRNTTWKLFGVIPLWRIKEGLPRLIFSEL